MLILSRSIDTPGVIDRVSTLFRGHPALIQGFNTFLPPGYRIECTSAEGEQDGLITVTTPSGTVSQVPGGFTAAMDKMHARDREREANAQAARDAAKRTTPGSTTAPFVPPTLPPLRSEFGDLAGGQRRPTGRSPPGTAAGRRPGPTNGTAPGPLTMPTPAVSAPSGPSTPSAAQFLASGGLGGATNPSPSNRSGNGAPILEFNHAIAFVNKIKQRFSDDQDTYKQFLEILQTYQRDTKDIAEVSSSVRRPQLTCIRSTNKSLNSSALPLTSSTSSRSSCRRMVPVHFRAWASARLPRQLVRRWTRLVARSEAARMARTSRRSRGGGAKQPMARGHA